MSAPKKPLSAASKRALALAAVPAPIVLTRDEAELLRCYRAMDLRNRSENLDLCRWSAEAYPMGRRTGPQSTSTGIRLVAAAGKRVAE